MMSPKSPSLTWSLCMELPVSDVPLTIWHQLAGNLRQKHWGEI